MNRMLALLLIFTFSFAAFAETDTLSRKAALVDSANAFFIKTGTADAEVYTVCYELEEGVHCFENDAGDLSLILVDPDSSAYSGAIVAASAERIGLACYTVLSLLIAQGYTDDAVALSAEIDAGSEGFYTAFETGKTYSLSLTGPSEKVFLDLVASTPDDSSPRLTATFNIYPDGMSDQ